MRSITNGEIERIQNQSLNRIYGRSEIAFELAHYAFYDPPGSDTMSNGVLGSPRIDTWSEEGFYGDFVLMRAESRPWDYTSIYTPATQITWTAAITLPFQYKEGFLTSQGTNAKGRPFKLEPSPGGVAVHDTVYCNQIWVKNMDGKPLPNDMPNVFTVIDEPVTTLDGIYFRLEAYGAKGYWINNGQFPKGRFDRQPNRPGVGVVDAAGMVSDSKGTMFQYKTRGDLRRNR